MTQWMGDALAGVNVILAGLMAVYQGKLLLRCKGQMPGWCWLRMVLMLVAMYWAGLYLFVLLKQPGAYDAVLFGQVFVRPAFTFTLAILAAAAIQRSRAG
jgi:hypothetical protein